ncbi:MAG: GNAT family N-acetyltransferase [Clostridia bacterium]|nr:GNAT family N-acetyltransferase [Clostridia bacterium]
MVRLEKIGPKNVWEVVDLKLKREQKNFVAPNHASIIDAYTTIGTGCTAFPFAIISDRRPVGFIMIGYNEAALYDCYGDMKAPEISKNNYSIWRLMIDKRYQKRGYGREAVKLALDFIKTWPCGKAEYCYLSYEPENEIAAKMYHSLGFLENGEMDGDEIVAVLKL